MWRAPVLCINTILLQCLWRIRASAQISASHSRIECVIPIRSLLLPFLGPLMLLITLTRQVSLMQLYLMSFVPVHSKLTCDWFQVIDIWPNSCPYSDCISLHRKYAESSTNSSIPPYLSYLLPNPVHVHRACHILSWLLGRLHCTCSYNIAFTTVTISSAKQTSLVPFISWNLSMLL